ncbi:DprA-like protein [Vibrio phage VP-1]|uniref:DprA-like protein n=1 Tax=Vibrio phage VP-1 TaxID=2234088 RepID=A0A4P2THB9_9CAUD|nr:DprA-like protein [Vibrio phage VP-1]
MAILGRKTYAGVGSRKAPEWACKKLSLLAYVLASEGYICNSGLAPQSDEAFYWGIKAYCDEMKADLDKLYKGFIPWNGFMKKWYFHMPGVTLIQDPTLIDKATAIAKRHMSQSHWDACTEQAQQLHSRNSFQMYGEKLNKRVGFVACWAPPTGKGDHVKGGTGQTVRIGIKEKMPIFNIATKDGLRWANTKIQKFLGRGGVFPKSLLEHVFVQPTNGQHA